MKLTAYTDVSYIVAKVSMTPRLWVFGGTLGWAYVVMEPNGKIIGPVSGARPAERVSGQPHFEQIPKDIVKKRFSYADEIVFLTDHKDTGGIVVDKHDPWHLVCHYASKMAALRSELRKHKT